MVIWIPIHNQSSSTNAIATFATSNETFSVFQTPSSSLFKMEDKEE